MRVGRRNSHRARSLTRLSLLTLTVLGLAACSAGPFAEANDVSAIKEDLVKLQGANGLVRMPESAGQERGDLYTTALYSDDLGPSLLTAGDASKVVDDDLGKQDTADLLTLWSALKVLKATGGELPGILDKKLADAAIPPTQQDVGAEIAALWFWIDLGRMRDWSGGHRSASEREVVSRLKAIDIASIKEKPYLLWRLFDSYSALKVQGPEELETALKSLDIKKLPSDYESTLDFQAALETRIKFDRDLLVPNDAKGHIVRILESGQVDDDALIDSMLRSLELLDARAERQRIVKEKVVSRLDAGNGLIRSSALDNGSVHGTYLAARLLDTEFPEVAGERTRDQLVRAIEAPKADLITQLKALVALKRSGSDLWRNYSSVIQRGKAGVPGKVTQTNLGEYIELIDVLAQLDPDVKLARLEPFDADPAAEEPLSKALLALTNSMYFANNAEVRSMFPAVQAKLPGLIREPGSNGLNYFRALTAMTSASLSGLGSDDFDAAAEELRKLKGCKEFPSLYRLESDQGAQCSLSLSAAMIAVPGAYNLGENK